MAKSASTSNFSHSRSSALLVGLGGLLLIVGSLMKFGRPDDDASGDPIRGVDTADGKFFILIGAALILAAVVQRSKTSAMVATVGVMFSVFGSLLVFYMSLVDLFALVGVEAGLFLVVSGAALATIGGTMSLLTYRRRRPPGQETP